MTRRPHEDQVRFVPAEGPKYEVNPKCAVPRCGFPSFDPHHVWRRSAVGGPTEWMLDTSDGTLIRNVVGLCRSHHQDVTGMVGGYKAHIKYDEGRFWWIDLEFPMDPKPLRVALAEPDFVPEVVTDTRAASSVGDSAPDASGSASACPTCGRKTPKPKSELEPTRPKVNFNVKVPKDALEDGHAILTELFAQARELLGRDKSVPTYFVLVEVLYGWITDHGHKKAA